MNELRSCESDLAAVQYLDAAREMDAVEEALGAAKRHLRFRDQANAEVHMELVRYSPITESVAAALRAARRVRWSLCQHEPVTIAGDDRARRLIITISGRAFEQLEAMAAAGEQPNSPGWFAEALLHAAIEHRSSRAPDTALQHPGHDSAGGADAGR